LAISRHPALLILLFQFFLHDVPAGEDRVNKRQFIANEPDVLLHARNVGLGQVGSVKVVHEVHQATTGKNEKIQFADEFLLLRSLL